MPEKNDIVVEKAQAGRPHQGKVFVAVHAHLDDVPLLCCRPVCEADGGRLHRHTWYALPTTKSAAGNRRRRISSPTSRNIRRWPRRLGFRDVYDLYYQNHEMDAASSLDLRGRLIFLFRYLKADTVLSFNPWGEGEENPDHWKTGRAVEEAAWMAGVETDYHEHAEAGILPHECCERYYFYARPGQAYNRVVDIGASIEKKIDAISRMPRTGRRNLGRSYAPGSRAKASDSPCSAMTTARRTASTCASSCSTMTASTPSRTTSHSPNASCISTSARPGSRRSMSSSNRMRCHCDETSTTRRHGGTRVAVSAVQSSTGELPALDDIAAAAASRGDDRRRCHARDRLAAAGRVALRRGGVRVLQVADVPARHGVPRPQRAVERAHDPAPGGLVRRPRPAADQFGPPLRLPDTARRFDTSPAWFCGWNRAGAGAAEPHRRRGHPRARPRARQPLPRRARPGGGDSAIVSDRLRRRDGQLARAGIMAAARAGRLRASFHLYNTEADVDAALAQPCWNPVRLARPRGSSRCHRGVVGDVELPVPVGRRRRAARRAAASGRQVPVNGRGRRGTRENGVVAASSKTTWQRLLPPPPAPRTASRSRPPARQRRREVGDERVVDADRRRRRRRSCTWRRRSRTSAGRVADAADREVTEAPSARRRGSPPAGRCRRSAARWSPAGRSRA